MSNYHIIDEPRPKKSQDFIVNPIAVLLAAMLVPMFVQIPLYGKFWLPFIWLIVNGYLLGSPTFWREFFYAIFGLLAIVCTFIGYGYGVKAALISSPNSFAPYLRVLINVIYLVALYLIVFTQSVPYSVFEYVKQRARHE